MGDNDWLEVVEAMSEALGRREGEEYIDAARRVMRELREAKKAVGATEGESLMTAIRLDDVMEARKRDKRRHKVQVTDLKAEIGVLREALEDAKQAADLAPLYWCVWSPENGPPTVRQKNGPTAAEEARRLALENPGDGFHVMTCMAVFRGRVLVAEVDRDAALKRDAPRPYEAEVPF